ncbi:restriction endonuclease subunit S [Nocardia thailandica]
MTVTLNEIAEINPKLRNRPQLDELVSFLGMTDVDAEYGTTSKGDSKEFGEVAKGYTQFENGDLLVAKITPCFENGKIAQAILEQEKGAGSTEFHVVRPHPDQVDHRYLLHFLRQPYIRVAGERRMTGSGGQRRVPEAYISHLKLRLPELGEQKRIAEVLDRVDELRAKRRQSIALLDDLARSIFLGMFNTASTPSWPGASLEDVAEVQGGLQVTSKRKGLPIEVPYLRVANVYRDRMDLSEIKTIRVTERELQRTMLTDGDILIVEGHGNPKEIGRAAMWSGAIGSCSHQNHLIRVRVDRERVLPRFVTSFVNSGEGMRHLLRSANTTSGLNTISTADVRSLPVRIPPLALQKAYCSRVDGIESTKRAALQHLDGLDRLFSSLQSRAFNGNLWKDDTKHQEGE